MTRVGWWLLVILLALALGEWLLVDTHRLLPWHRPGGMALLGLVGCVAVSLLAKKVAKPLLQRPESPDES